MKCKNRENINGYSEGYNYPIEYYKMDNNKKSIPEINGSFWVPCDKKTKGRHSFCDGY